MQYAQKRAYLLLQHKEVAERILELEKTYIADTFQKLSFQALKELEDILKDSENRHVQLLSAKLILQASGILDHRGNSNQAKPKKVFKLINYMKEDYINE